MAISTFDARNGLSTEVLQGLGAAHRVVLALKDARTAALGYWIKTRGPDQQETEEFRLVILDANVSLTHGRQVSDEQPLTIGAAQDDLLWQEALKHLHPGDVAVVQWAGGPAAVLLALVKHARSVEVHGSAAMIRKWTVPLSEELWGAPMTPKFIPTYFLGHTTNQRRWRSGQTTLTWRVRPA